MPPEIAYALMVFFAAVLGGSVGSFLNVVVYRLPNGLSLISPPSHCPQCKHSIRWHDNVPVFGWIGLRGRCRDCRNWIPIRYPLVEAITAAMFAGVAAVEGPFTADYPAACFYHLLLLCTLLCAALIEIDGCRPPLRLFIPTILVGVLGPLVVAIPQPTLLRSNPSPARPLDLFTGLAAGALVAGGLWLGVRFSRTIAADRPQPSAGLPLGLLSTGIYLGWLSLGVIALVTFAVSALFWLAGRGNHKLSVPPSVWLLLSVLTWLLAAGL